jgi:Glyoxalase/Bleomycin resistance protein/Dioxygenase superfamily
MLPGLPLFQYAYFVENVHEAAEHWGRAVGAGPFFVTAHHVANTFDYRGTAIEADVTYAFGYAGDCQIQLIEQHDDQPSIYRDMYPTGFGFHHVASLVHDYSGARQHLLDLGYDLACELHANDIDACYFDATATLGCFVELHSYTDRIANTFARWKSAHDEWDKTGSAIRTHRSGT